MENVDAYKAKTHLPKLLERVMKGEQITITKHGIPVAVLRPPYAQKKVDVKSLISELLDLRDRHSLGELSLKDMIEEVRR